jgi:uncharacterized phiE125 gp8 family phage protein
MGLNILAGSGPPTEPILLAEVKSRLHLSATDDDSYITSLITTARVLAEKWTGWSLASKTYQLTRVGFPWPSQSIKLPVPPVSLVTSVSYFADDSGEWTVWDSSDYLVGLSQFPALIRPVNGGAYPCPFPTGDVDNVQILFTAGPAEGALNPDFSLIYEGIRQLAQHFYEHPSAVSDAQLKEMPFGMQTMFSPKYRPLH